MHELNRRQYLDAMGIASYVSRGQLPGAAPTRRLRLVPDQASPEPLAASPAAPTTVPTAKGPGSPQNAPPALAEASQLLRDEPKPSETPVSAPVNRPRSEAVRFSVVTLTLGGWLWVEEIQQGNISEAYMQLVQGLARALGATQSGYARFDWPLHQSQQLDAGADVAREALNAFLHRRLDTEGLQGVLLAGDVEARWVDASEFPAVRSVPADIGQMLEAPLRKREVWAVLHQLQTPAGA